MVLRVVETGLLSIAYYGGARTFSEADDINRKTMNNTRAKFDEASDATVYHRCIWWED